MKFTYVTNDISETSVKNHIYHCTTPHETVICGSDGTTGDHKQSFALILNLYKISTVLNRQ
jgi:hypothetical protein